MAYNTTAELRELYLQQSRYSAEPPLPYQPPLLEWPSDSDSLQLKPDADLLEKVLSVDLKRESYSVAEQVFGDQKQQGYTGLKHLIHLMHERAGLHQQHVRDIDHRHIEVQEKLFGVNINHTPDRAKRQSVLEGQLLQLEQQRREEELAFWKDTVDVREKLFETAEAYKAAKHRYSVFARVEGQYGQ
jgi:hypothetical protein